MKNMNMSCGISFDDEPTDTTTIRSLWHQTNSKKEILNGIDTEYNYLKDNNLKES